MAVNFKPYDEYLLIDVTGIWDVSTAKLAQEEAMKIMSESNLSKLILDISKTDNKFTITQIFEINTRVPLIFPPNFKHAIIFSLSMMRLVEAEFSENVAVNRGVNIKMFDNQPDAEEWLLG